jgi:hypothetical protein
MIAIILIILIILKFKGRSDGSYKVDESKNYNYGQQAALLNGNQMNGNLYNDKAGSAAMGGVAAAGNGGGGGGNGAGGGLGVPAGQANKSGASRKQKDVKEWYV